MYNENYLSHYGVKGMKWGVRRVNTNSSISKKLGKMVGKRVEKTRAKAEKRKKSYEKTTDVFGVGGAALRSYTEYRTKKAVKGTMAKIINASANAYISSNSSKYNVARGVDFARKAAIGGLSLSSNIDQIQAYANVARSYMYAVNK